LALLGGERALIGDCRRRCVECEYAERKKQMPLQSRLFRGDAKLDAHAATQVGQ
jgi:hypothetical protein